MNTRVTGKIITIIYSYFTCLSSIHQPLNVEYLSVWHCECLLNIVLSVKILKKLNLVYTCLHVTNFLNTDLSQEMCKYYFPDWKYQFCKQFWLFTQAHQFCLPQGIFILPGNWQRKKLIELICNICSMSRHKLFGQSHINSDNIFFKLYHFLALELFSVRINSMENWRLSQKFLVELQS